VRIGVATGLVVVGDIIGTGEAQERGIIGEMPNPAARRPERSGHDPLGLMPAVAGHPQRKAIAGPDLLLPWTVCLKVDRERRQGRFS
jgi:hypothetical protein